MNTLPSQTRYLDQMTASPAVLPVPDLDEALGYFVGKLGFRLDRIWPADDPRVAQISGHDVRFELRLNGEECPIPDQLPALSPQLEISRIADARWGVGRAGMRYRDLLPGRQGGHFIASHIQIPGRGPVPDQVHFHEVQFQMIFCYRGRVRVAYEGQGPPFWMRPGDCVLQPPTIRHRVLESDDDLEVIEIGGPAIHVTAADHGLSLPTPKTNADRLFGGQRFVLSRSDQAEWTTRGSLEHRDLGISAATDGLAEVTLIRGSGPLSARHRGALLFLFVLEGRLQIGGEQLGAGDSIALPGSTDGVCDGKVLQVCLPAQ